jgi:hypothetical protein
VTNDEEYIVTTTIMHFRAFNPEIMDSRTGASGRRGYKCVVNREKSSRSLGVNDGETDRSCGHV